MYKSQRYIVSQVQDRIYCFNTLNGLLECFEGSIAQFLLGEDVDLTPEELNMLREHEYIFDNEDEYHQRVHQLLTILHRLHKKQGLNFILIPSFQCNLRCSYCYENQVINTGTSLSDEMVEDMLEAVQRLAGDADLRNVDITLMGGEPLLRENENNIRKILEFVQKVQCKWSVVTNGTTLLYYLPLFREYGVMPHSMQVTIDGIPEIHDQRRCFPNKVGSFKVIERGIDAVLKEKIQLFVRINIDETNLPTLPALKQYMTEKGWLTAETFHPYIYTMSDGGCLGQQFCLDEVEVTRRAVEMTERDPSMGQIEWNFHGLLFLTTRLRGKECAPFFSFCGANRGQYVLDQNGGIYTCWWAIDTPELKVGTFSPSFQIHENQVAQWRERTIMSIPECRDCKYSLICGGGCAYKAYKQFGSLNKPRCSQFAEIYAACMPNLYHRINK